MGEDLHLDCLNYAPIDVSKGFCHRTKELIYGDDLCCARLERVPKCKNCSLFRPDADRGLTGQCAASASGFVAYGEMVARTCSDYRACPGGE